MRKGKNMENPDPGRIGRVKTIKSTILKLFFLIIVLWIAISILFVFAYTSFNEIPMEKTLKIFSSLPFILYICAIFLVGTLVLFKIVTTTRILDNYAILDSEEINKMIAKSTAPFRERYYLIYNTTKQKDSKITHLRRHLEKLQTKIEKTDINGDKS
jgi:uncharacterized integral membrane protein